MKIRNSINLIGHVGQDPEIINAKSNGNPFLRFPFATNDFYHDRDGNRVTRTEWHTIMVFGDKRVERLRQEIKKGSYLVVTGTLRYSRWTDKHEQTRISASIHADEILPLPSRTATEKAAVAVA